MKKEKIKLIKRCATMLTAITLVCSPIAINASSKSTVIKVGSSKIFTVSKKYGKITKVSYAYPDKKNKGKVKVKRTSTTKVKITGTKAGKIKVKIRFKSRATKSYNIVVKKKNEIVCTFTPIKIITPKVTNTPVVTSTPVVTNTPVVTSTHNVTSNPAITSTPVVTSTPSANLDGLTSIYDTCSKATVNKFEYKDISLEHNDYNRDGKPDSFMIKAITIKNISDEDQVPDVHIKYYDENGEFVCEFQRSWDTGSHWNVTLKPNQEYLLFMCTTPPGEMGVDKDTFNKIKYWKLVNIE